MKEEAATEGIDLSFGYEMEMAGEGAFWVHIRRAEVQV